MSGWVPGGVTVRLRVVSPIGMGMRAATRLSRLAGDYPCNVRLRHGPVWADAKDILALMSLGVDAGSTLSIETSGNKADKAARMIAWMVGNSYDGETVRAGMDQSGNARD
jgi:phosphocarrier protein